MTEHDSNRRTHSTQLRLSGNPVSDVALDRRAFVKLVGAGLLITVTERDSSGQRRGSRGARNVAARLQIHHDGTISVMTGKVEEGQGSRTQLTQAAAEELRVDVAKIRLVMADTDLVPDDGITAGSRTTPSTVPAVRRGAATARELLAQMAAGQWQVDRGALVVKDGVITHEATKRGITYAELASSKEVTQAFQQSIPDDIEVTPLGEWSIIGTSVSRPNARDLVTGAHHYPSDIARPNMLYGKILRPPSYGATLENVDLSPAEAMHDVTVVRDGQFIGFTAPTTFQAEQARNAVAATATWKTVAHPSSEELFRHLEQHAGRGRPGIRGSIDDGFDNSKHVLNEKYEVAYVQHTPMEPRAATAEWKDGKLTVWTGVDGPQRVQGDLSRAFGVPAERVRVIVPDMGGGFGGKHTGEAAEEAARLAKVVGRPVAVHWTRAEEFTWAYFRPASVIECRAGLDEQRSLVAWDFKNINAGGSALETPYDIPNTQVLSVGSDSPLRQGAYRCLAATANNFARESFMDELAAVARADPLAFRLTHLRNERIRKVLEVATKHFNWSERSKNTKPELGVGLACGTEKNSVVAACVEVAINRELGEIEVREVCQAFECGPVQNPANLVSQVQGCIMMGIGPALREEIRFAGGKILTDGFATYRVPRFKDMPKIDVHLVDNPDIPSAGGGETPLIALAPAIGNAVFAATGIRIRSMPIRLPKQS
jgi:CO/xanthine dehydrogenase Mo-binding subunit